MFPEIVKVQAHTKEEDIVAESNIIERRARANNIIDKYVKHGAACRRAPELFRRRHAAAWCCTKRLYSSRLRR